MVGVTKLRIKFGNEGSVKTFRLLPDLNNCSNASKLKESIGVDEIKAENQSKKRGPEELEEVQANKKQKLDRALSSQCIALLRLLMEHQLGWIFSEPVDPVKLKIPDYFSVISNPMDLGTIKSKLLKNSYRNADEFAADVRLTFANAMLYNPPGNSVHIVAKELKGIFEVRWDSIKKKKGLGLSGFEVQGNPKKQPFKVDCIRRSSPQTSSSSEKSSVELKKTEKEKSENVSLLLKPAKGQSKNDNTVGTRKALSTELRLKKLMQGLGISPTVKSPGKGSAPTTACKCSSCGGITCICLKSSNSSGSEISSLTVCSEGSENSRNEKNGCVSSQIDKPYNNGLLDNELKTTVPAMPPLPPEKALRIATLKGQYAETILRAKHKKVFDQSNKADLNRIRIEKEQMERAQREEKARIEAEMRAAKIAAQTKAENERKQERERARLQQEKIVKTCDLEDIGWGVEKEMANLCGNSYLTRRWMHKLGLFLRADDYLEETDSKFSYAMRMEDLEEGEIL